jgi:SOS-response transcriptional repressor LexA
MANGVHPLKDIQKWINKATTNSYCGLEADYPNMYNPAMEISRIIQGVLQARGWTQEQLADRLRTSQNNISRWVGGVEPRGAIREQILNLARESDVIEHERAARTVVPIMGRIGAGALIEPDHEQVPVDGFDQVELPLLLSNELIGFKVEGNSMLPKYDHGDIIVVHREQVRSTASLVGEQAAVRTYDGKRYLKVLMPGPKPHTYNLESFNARTIIGAHIQWASEIVAIIPSKQVRHKRLQARKGPQAGARRTGKHA